VRWTPLLALVALTGCSGSAEPPRDDGAELVRAAGEGDLPLLRGLIESGVDVDARDATGRTAITASVYGGHVDVVRALVDAGADPDLQDDMRANALLATGETGNVEVLREVLRAEPDLARTNRFGGTALIPAAHRGHVEVVRELLGTEIDVDHVNEPGWTALLEAVILGDGGPAHREIVRLLVAAGADVNLPDAGGVTPLQHARSRGYAEIERELEAAGAR
jgi:ankyrin repeat protein